MRSKINSGFKQVCSLVLGSVISYSVLAGDEPSVTPYRPTVSNPAALSEPGWLEMEVGYNRQKLSDDSRQGSLPYQLKYAFSEDFGILLGGDALVVQNSVNGERLAGLGDTQFLLKHRWPLASGEDAPALGLEWGVKSPTAKTGIGSGRTDYLANGIYSATVAGFSLDLNLNATRLGVADPGTGSVRWGWAATLSRALNERWTLAGELSGTARRGTGAENQALFAVSYALNRRVVLDGGFALGLSRAPLDKGIFFGLSVLLEKIR